MGRPCLLLALVCLLACVFSAVSLNPGFQFRVSSKGLSYANQVAVDILSKKLLAMHIPEVSGGDSKLHYDVKNLRIKSFHPPTSGISILAGQGLRWGIHNAAISVDAEFHVTKKVLFVSLHPHGDLSADASGVALSVDIAMGKDSTGHPTIHATNCKASLGSLKVKIRNGGFFTWLYNLLIKAFSGKIKGLLEDQMCKIATNFVNDDGNKKLAAVPVQADFLKQFDLDYHLLTPPVFTPHFVEVSNKGLVYWHGDHHEPPSTCPALPANHATTQMAEIWVTECLANSMAYAAHAHHFTRYTVDDLPSGVRTFLKTSCTGVCLGTLFPEIAHKHPNAQAGISLYTTTAPRVDLTGGVATVHVTGKADLAIGSTSLFALNLDLVLSLSTAIHRDHLVVKIIKMDPKFSVTVSSVGTLPLDKVHRFLDVILNDNLIPHINAVAAQGLPLPVTGVVSLVNPHLQLLNKALLISTDLHYLG